MTFRNYLNKIDDKIRIEVSPLFEGDITVYSAVYAMYKILKSKDVEVCIKWPGHIPPAADKIFPLPLMNLPEENDIKHTIILDKGQIITSNGVYNYQYTPGELLIDGIEGPEDLLAAIFVSLYSGTRRFSVDNLPDDIFDWFQRLLERGFSHYQYVNYIYVISSPDVFHVWGKVMKEAKLTGDIVISVYEGDKQLLPPEWYKVASYLARYTGKGLFYVKKHDGYEYFDSDGGRGMVSNI